jgi:1-acyl-sn-glycerol-3-phosphate acyltransferase
MSDSAGKDEVASASTGGLDQFSVSVTKTVVQRVAPILRRYFRAELHGLDSFPTEGGALVVSNHSGGMLTPDVMLFGSAFYRRFGYDRPLITLAHYGVVMGPLGNVMPKVGVIEASRENAAAALAFGGVVLVFPGGDYDSYRPTSEDSVIDFAGRTGYVHTAIAAGVPIVPSVSIGGQESQWFLTRGNALAKLLGLTKARMEILPVTFGFPFGFSVIMPPNLPLPTKIVTQVLEPIDIVARFGPDPDVDEVDVYVRSVMQSALNELARKRRFPILG